MDKQRNIVLCIVFTIITCGIYGIYWMIKLNDGINELAGEPMATSGGMVVLFSLITCGIYGIYWSYKMGQRVDIIGGNANGNTAILYLILSLFGFSIINFCLMQDTVNKKIAQGMIYVIAIGCLYYVWFVITGIGIPCVFRSITGWLCPGCGITTLLVRLSHLDIRGAYAANSFLFVTGPLLIAFVLYDGWQRRNHKVARPWQNVAIGLYLIGLIGFGIWRNVH